MSDLSKWELAHISREKETRRRGRIERIDENNTRVMIMLVCVSSFFFACVLFEIYR